MSMIEYTIKLQDEGMTATAAYKTATDEFVYLRAKHEMASMAAEIEARHHGGEFSATPIVSHLGP
jgi:small subunit ribosomal protein S23